LIQSLDVNDSAVQQIQQLKSQSKSLDKEIFELEEEIKVQSAIQSIKESIEALSNALLSGNFEIGAKLSSNLVFYFNVG
jgi:chromosome segregation ATPase